MSAATSIQHQKGKMHKKAARLKLEICFCLRLRCFFSKRMIKFDLCYNPNIL